MMRSRQPGPPRTNLLSRIDGERHEADDKEDGGTRGEECVVAGFGLFDGVGAVGKVCTERKVSGKGVHRKKGVRP
jgi:hypothetical protein